MEMAMHASDISAAARPFEIARAWVYLLFEEFFKEGDLEKDNDLPVTFLCDRETTFVPQT